MAWNEKVINLELLELKSYKTCQILRDIFPCQRFELDLQYSWAVGQMVARKRFELK